LILLNFAGIWLQKLISRVKDTALKGYSPRFSALSGTGKAVPRYNQLSAGICFLTSKTKLLYAHLARSRYRKTMFAGSAATKRWSHHVEIRRDMVSFSKSRRKFGQVFGQVFLDFFSRTKR
jgi:hypothetical protein